MSETNRLAVLAIAWTAATIISVGSMIFAGGNFLVILVAVLAAAYATSEVMDSGKTVERPKPEKAKRLETGYEKQQMDMLLQLLDEDDVYELRERIKMRLMDNIDTRTDGELSTLDALLADQERRSSRK